MNDIINTVVLVAFGGLLFLGGKYAMMETLFTFALIGVICTLVGIGRILDGK